MKGSHRIIVESRKVKYDFIIKRNITILTGDSGSGKTVLIDLIHDYRRYGADSGVQLSCDRACRTIDSEDWERELKEISDSIIFIDEGNRFLKSKKFAELQPAKSFQRFPTALMKYTVFVNPANSIIPDRLITNCIIYTVKFPQKLP